MNWQKWLLLAMLAALAFGVCACSKEQGSQKAKGTRLTTQRAAKAIEHYGNKFIDKARQTQQLGEQRTKTIDEDVKKMTGR